MKGDFRLIQDGVPVVWVTGNNLTNEVEHYADVLEQFAPVVVQHKVNGRWKEWKGKSK
jgi:hydroxymethylpyrimidine pyrophosphatase-like HAD family hydrolase